MFKRVEKRLKRKEREDELGLDEDMKDVLGLNDTDSDESDSDSSAQGSFLAIDNNGDEDEDLELGTASDDELERREDEADAERALVTVSEALNNPVFIVSLDPDISECIVCPGKLLKGTTMAEKHKTSNAHERRFKQFQKLAASAHPKDRAQELVGKAMGKTGPQTAESSETSKRAEKKRIAREKRKVKRQKFKARLKAKRDALAGEGPVESEKKESISRKKRKSGDGIQDVEAVKGIGRKKIGAIASDGTDIPSAEAKKSGKRDIRDAAEPSKKKQKTSTIPLDTVPFSTTTSSQPTRKRFKLVTPTATKPKSKPTPEHEGSAEPIQELQAQVKDIIKSASSLAKVARARALGGDGDGEAKIKQLATVKAKTHKR